jgi:hypothetical protein
MKDVFKRPNLTCSAFLLLTILANASTALAQLQSGTGYLAVADFRKKIDAAKRDNVFHIPDSGLILDDNNEPGKLVSKPLKLAVPTDVLQTTWVSAMPNDAVMIRVQTSADGKGWLEWVLVNDQIRVTRQGVTFGRLLMGLNGAMYVRYEISIQADPKRLNRGVISLLSFLAISNLDHN